MQLLRNYIQKNVNKNKKRKVETNESEMLFLQ